MRQSSGERDIHRLPRKTAQPNRLLLDFTLPIGDLPAMSIRRVVPIEQAQWSIAQAPDWIHRREIDWTFVPAEESPVSLLLIDEQHHIPSHAASYRSVRRVLTHDAVRGAGQVGIDFDPAAHRLSIHEVAIWRQSAEGTWERRSFAQRENFMLRQREQGFEQQILNGWASIVGLLEDLRVGDAIELAWTVEPRDPLAGLRFTAYNAFAWSVPMGQAFFTLHDHVGQGIRWRLHAGSHSPEPAVEVTPHHATWKVERQAGYTSEPNVPGGKWDFPMLDVSGWNTWGEVANFLADLWADTLSDGPEAVAEQAAALRVEGDLASSARAAIRWVQEEVRYLAVDFGHGGGILPNAAGTVLRRRFGDCKDKAVLLVALLRALGMEAWPMLVASHWRGAVANVQPSTAAFSHAIVTFMDGETRRFVDPTMVGQGGDLANLTLPEYGCGLEVRKDCAELITLPELTTAELTLIETFHLHRRRPDGYVEQVLRATGWLADEVRAALLGSGRAAFFKVREGSLKGQFPQLQLKEDSTEVEDNLAANMIEVRAQYALPAWGRAGEPLPPLFQYGAYGLFLVVEGLEGPDERRQPWALRHPFKVHHRVVARGRCVKKAKPERHRAKGPGFRYRCDVNSKRHEVSFDYHWETTQREVPAADWSEYRIQRNRALEQAGANVITKMPSFAKPRSVMGVVAGFAILVSVLVNVSTGSRRHEARQIHRPGPVPVHQPAAPVSLLGQPFNPNQLQAIDLAPAQMGLTKQRSGNSARLQAEQDLRIASQAINRGDYQTAVPLLQRAYPYFAGNFDYHALRAEAAIRLQDLPEADAALMAARSIEPENPKLAWLKLIRQQAGK